MPKIDNTRAELDWTPRVTMEEALRQIFDAYRGQIGKAGALLEQERPTEPAVAAEASQRAASCSSR